MAIWMTEPLTDTSTKNAPGVKTGWRARKDNLIAISESIV
jgi:hypothetical protein